MTTTLSIGMSNTITWCGTSGDALGGASFLCRKAVTSGILRKANIITKRCECQHSK